MFVHISMLLAVTEMCWLTVLFQGYNTNKEFIVTQHPMAGTTDDFWRMVWDQNSMTIVLLSVIDDVCVQVHRLCSQVALKQEQVIYSIVA